MKRIRATCQGWIDDYLIKFTYISGVKGVYDSEPFDCYPGEPAEIEIFSIKKDGRNVKWSNQHIMDFETKYEDELIRMAEEYIAEGDY